METMNEKLNKYQGIFPAFYACYGKDGSPCHRQVLERYV